MKSESKPIPADLMIGNWIFNGEEYTQFKYYRINKIYHTYGWFVFDAEENIGIPITPEILEKAGFELVKTLSSKEGYYYRKEYPQLQIYGGKVFVGSPCLNHVQYVHQLQNLFFCLTGSPLNLTL